MQVTFSCPARLRCPLRWLVGFGSGMRFCKNKFDTAVAVFFFSSGDSVFRWVITEMESVGPLNFFDNKKPFLPFFPNFKHVLMTVKPQERCC